MTCAVCVTMATNISCDTNFIASIVLMLKGMIIFWLSLFVVYYMYNNITLELIIRLAIYM